MIQEVEGKRYIVRYAREDQFPAGTNLQDAARDSVIRFASHHGLAFRWYHDQAGSVWVWSELEGCYFQKSPMRLMWRSEAIVIDHAAGDAR